jgi:ATP-dependent Clp protease protease subunit
MPIGVPRIIYCWGEELPAQWTDIYNFIFRRRMVFLMQYLDDELCNQICGLLINIHMEDRGKELEKKEIERSGLFKTGSKSQKLANDARDGLNTNNQTKSSQKTSFEDLLASDEDLGIDDNKSLEQYTLQKITMEWLNWNAQFFDYSDEPYLFYLAEMLSNDFKKKDAKSLNFENNFKDLKKSSSLLKYFNNFSNTSEYPQNFNSILSSKKTANNFNNISPKNHLDVYSPFRLLANFAAQDYNFEELNPLIEIAKKTENDKSSKTELFQLFNKMIQKKNEKENTVSKLLSNLSQQNFSDNLNSKDKLFNSAEKALSQRNLRKEYKQEKQNNLLKTRKFDDTPFASVRERGREIDSLNYLDFYSYQNSYTDFKKTQNSKQSERLFQNEETKKVFVIINSFGGSVGNGITVHDALQFIKAGSLTLALGVAASAASLALAGGTIGERYVTEGCHVMIHQPESSIQGQASDIWIDSQEIMKIRLDVAEIYSLATYRPRHKILRDLDRDFYLTATETIHYGLADEIATNEVMKDIIEMTSKVWDYHDTKQQRLLETRDINNSAADTQAQN